MAKESIPEHGLVSGRAMDPSLALPASGSHCIDCFWNRKRVFRPSKVPSCPNWMGSIRAIASFARFNLNASDIHDSQ